MERYSKICLKQKREIVLLRGRGCAYGQCAFCDYHLDRNADDGENFSLNQKVLAQVTGEFGELEVINSGSVFELDCKTLALIRTVCREKEIKVIHFEAHYLYRDQVPALRREFSGFKLKMKLGLESFDYAFREGILKKGISVRDPAMICRNFNEANLLVGVAGQTVASMENDIAVALRYFERICVNVMCKNTTEILPDEKVISAFMQQVYPKYQHDPRVDILISNTDFGVGGEKGAL